MADRSKRLDAYHRFLHADFPISCQRSSAPFQSMSAWPEIEAIRLPEAARKPGRLCKAIRSNPLRTGSSIRWLGQRHDNAPKFLASIKLNCNLVARSVFGQNRQQLRTFMSFCAMPMPMRSHSRTGEAKKQRHVKN
jgi:hypothetical protein